VRTLFAAVGLARWILAAVAVLAAFFLADRLLDLPLGVRRFVRLGLLQAPVSWHLLGRLPLVLLSGFLAVAFTRRARGAAAVFAFAAAGAAGLLAWCAARAFVPLRTRLPDEDLALSVEQRFRHLKDRLAAALDFEQELRHPSRGESPTMMAAVIREAGAEARGLHFSRAVSSRRALRWTGAATLVLAAAVGVTAVLHDDVALWARRSLLLENVPWPRATTMRAVDLGSDGSFVPHDPATPYEVPIGRSLTVYARAEGEVPDGAEILDLLEGQQPLSRRMFTVAGHADVFAYEFLDVRRPFSFVVRGGDDEDDEPGYGVVVTIPPRVLSIRSAITYPEYLGRPPEVVADGTVALPQGSKVQVTFTTDLDIAKAQVVLGDRTLAATPAQPGARRAFTFGYEADTSMQGRLVLHTPDGKENDPAADSFEVRVKVDQPPRLDWIWPAGGVDVTPTGRVPLLAQCTDDHGVASLALDVRVNAAKSVRYPLRPYVEDAQPEGPVPVQVNDGPYGRTRVLTYVPLEIKRLRRADGKPLDPQDSVGVRLAATDSRGQIRETEWLQIAVRSAPVMERNLARERSNVRPALEAVRREQASRRDDIQSVLEGTRGPAELDLVKSVRFAQSKIAQDADRAVRQLIDVFNGFVYDRLGAENPDAKILGFLDSHHRATYGLRPDDSEEPATHPAPARGDWIGDPVFPYALYDRIVAAWRSKVIYDKSILDKMCAALASAVDVGSRLAPRAHRAAAAAVSGDEDRLRALLVAQEQNLAGLDQLLEAMSGWQNLNEMRLRLRGIINEQKHVLHSQTGQDEREDASSKKDEPAKKPDGPPGGQGR
jgi:hypothetical protein